MSSPAFTRETFVQKLISIYGDKFDYSNTDYINCKTKTEIICRKHGPFWITPDALSQSKHGCRKCSREELASRQRSNSAAFIEKARKVHGDTYDYSKVEYFDNTTKVIIICKKHGEFQQMPSNHLWEKGCPACKLSFLHDRFAFTLDEFVKRANKKYKNFFDYSRVQYINIDTPVRISCPKHGEFEQTPYGHLHSKYGCPRCGDGGRALSKRKSKYHFLDKMRKAHGDKYKYNIPPDSPLSHSKIEIICSKHGVFKQTVHNHIQGNGCPTCSQFDSSLEKFVRNFLTKENIPFVERDRKILSGKEIDVYIPSHKFGIECHGVYWHSELAGKDSRFHLEKLINCNKAGINLLQIFENEIQNKPKIVLARIKSKLNLIKYRIPARKCEVREIDTGVCSKFLNKYHIQGVTNSKIRLGLFYKNRLVSVMTFTHPRKCLGSKEGSARKYELVRFCSLFHFSVIGGASKLLKHFERKYLPASITSYADRRWSSGNLYQKLGFSLIRTSRPNYWYFNGGKVIELFHRFNFRKNILSKKLEKFDNKLSEWQNMINNGYNRIWDCGNLVFEKTYE